MATVQPAPPRDRLVPPRAASPRERGADGPGPRLRERARLALRQAQADPASTCGTAAALVHEARAAADTSALATALGAEARARRGMLQHEVARRLLDEAAQLAARHGDDAELGEVLVARAAVHQELGRRDSAQRDLERASALLPAAAGEAVRLQQGAILQNAGRLAAAAGVYRGVLARRVADVDVLAKVVNNLALVEVQLGRPDAARALGEEALSLAEAVGPALVALVAQSRAWITLQEGRVAESLRQAEDAGRRYREAGLPLGEHYTEYADALIELRLVAEADRLASRAVEEFTASGVALMAGEARLRVARLALLRGDLQRAEDEAHAAARAFRRQGRPGWAAQATVVAVEAAVLAGRVDPSTLTAARRAARTLEGCGLGAGAVAATLLAGRAAVALGRSRLAVELLQRASALSDGAPLTVRMKGRLAAALAAGLQGRDAETLRRCQQGLRDLDRHRSVLPSIELRALASGHGVDLGHLGLRVLLREGRPGRVLEWLEQTRAAALLAVGPAQPGGSPEELAALRQVQAQLLRGDCESEAHRSSLLETAAELESRIRRLAWAGGAPAVPSRSTSSPAELRRVLSGRVLVEYAVLDDEVLAVVLGPRRARLVRLGPLAPLRAEADALQFALRRLARPASAVRLGAARASATASLAALTAALAAPLRLDPDTPLVVVPSTALQHVPWSALHPAAVSVAPSAACWAASAAVPARPDVAATVLVAGPGLHGALAEVERLRRVYADPVVLTPPASTTAAVLDALSTADVAHLACHGRLRADSPTFSSLVLGDGELTLHEMDLHGVAPRRLVLASCDSGADVGYAGDEVLGFVSAMLARGSGGVVASRVSVPDSDVLPLTVGLHERVAAGATLADALAGARADLDLERPGELAVWCAFTAYGAA